MKGSIWGWLRRVIRGNQVFTGRTVFLDRDGTINVDSGYISHPRDIRLETNCPEGLMKLVDHGLDLVVFSNQSGIGRGYIAENDLLMINERIDNLLWEYSPDIAIKKYFFCPHAPEKKCDCRKPRTGMYEQFREQFPTDRPLVMIGDKYSDIRMLDALHIPAILVRTGEGRETERKLLSGELETPQNLALVADDLLQAAEFICGGQLARFQREQQRVTS